MGPGSFEWPQMIAETLNRLPGVPPSAATSCTVFWGQATWAKSIDGRNSQVVEVRFFGGLSVEETAEVLHVSPDTIKRNWRLGKLWLLREIEREGA